MTLVAALLFTNLFVLTAFASNTGNVAGAIEGSWQAASSQIKTVVNNVVFPAIDLVLTWIIGNTGSLNGLRPQFCLPDWSLL